MPSVRKKRQSACHSRRLLQFFGFGVADVGHVQIALHHVTVVVRRRVLVGVRVGRVCIAYQFGNQAVVTAEDAYRRGVTVAADALAQPVFHRLFQRVGRGRAVVAAVGVGEQLAYAVGAAKVDFQVGRKGGLAQ